jgi:hypothetical protein
MLTPAVFGGASWPAAGIVKAAASRNTDSILTYMEPTLSETQRKREDSV